MFMLFAAVLPIFRKKGTDWVISQLAQGVSTAELIDIYKYEYK